MLTLLLANQSAARDAPEPLPYLLQSAPSALRFAAARGAAPPPPKPVETADPTISTAEEAPPPVPDSRAGEKPGRETPSEAGNAISSDATNGTAAQPVSPAPPAGLPILPDGYAPTRPVSVEDLLPYFSAPPKVGSRATYDIK